MPRPPTDTPARRAMMQGVMWIILGATVGLAALVTHSKRSAIDITLLPAKEYRGVSAQLPKGWTITKGTDEQSSVLVTATEAKRSNGDEEPGGRVISILREPLGLAQTPREFANRLMLPGEFAGRDSLMIDHLPGELLGEQRELPAKSIRDALSGEVNLAKLIVAATIGPSGRGVAIQLDGEGEISAADFDLVKRIAATMKLTDEPSLIESGDVAMPNGIRVPIPTDLAAVKENDPLATSRVLRSKGNGSMKCVVLLPVVILPKDGGATILSMLSVDGGSFDDGQAYSDGNGGWRIEADSNIRRLTPLRAFAAAKAGIGVIAIFRGGDDDDWIQPAWDAMRQKLSFPDESEVADLVSNGAAAAGKLQQQGLKPYLPDLPDDLWWVQCLNTPDRGFGWTHFTAGASVQKMEGRLLLEDRLQQFDYEWRGTPDLKSYRTSITYDISDTREKEAPRLEQNGFDASFKAGKIDLRTKGSSRPVSYPAPPNYVPGGWLAMILPALVDRPMVIRTDSYVDYSYAQPRDLLTVMLRPEPDQARSTDDSGTKMKCISLQVSGATEKSLWFYRADGTLDGVDYPQGQRMVRSDEHEVGMQFARKEALKPSN